ncbi:MAG: patatin-like phospholipase family protein [Ignavibacteria bacterium]
MIRLLTIFIYLIIFINISFSQDISGELLQDTVKLQLTPKENLDTNYFNVFPKKYSNKKIALVLSGGGARGIAQLGVINELEKNNIRIDMIVGTSIGSIIGGFYSSGYSSSEIEDILMDFNWDRALSLTNKYQRTSLFLEQKKIQDRSLLTIPLDGIKPILLPSSLSNGQYLSEKINSYILNARYHKKKNFNDLKIDFAAVTTDIVSGKRVVLIKGNLSESIKASFTFPLLYTPINIDGRDLVDGGLTSNIPTDVAKNLGADYTIVVNSTSPLRSDFELDDPLNTADQILSIAMQQLSNLQVKDANTVINPDIKNYSATDFSNIAFLISKGQKAALQNIDNIISDIDSIELSESKYFNNFIINPRVEIDSDIYSAKYKDTLISLTEKNFERYTSIERNLRILYRAGNFKNVYSVISRDELSAKIVYHVTENPIVEKIVVKNSFQFLDSLIDKFETLNINNPVNFNTTKILYENILGALRKNSYSAVEIIKFYFDYKTNTLEIALSDGKVEDIELTGNKNTNSNVIIREFKFDKNIPVSNTNLTESIVNIMSTNLFKQVSFDFNYKKGITNPFLKVRVIEKNTKALRFSVKVDNERNLQLLLDLRDENIFGTAVESGILAAGGLRNRIYLFEIKSNQFFSLPLTFNFNTYYTFRDINRYVQSIDSVDKKFNVDKIGEYRNFRNGGFSFLFGTQLERLGTLYGQAFIENQEIKNKFGSESLSEKLRVVKLKFGGIFDTEDILPFPTKGYLMNFYYETANNILAGNSGYTKLFISYEQYFPIGKSQTLRPKFIFGFGDKTTPLTEQYSLGGEKSFFGMVEDELRGRQILETSIEYRYLFPYKLFFDTYLSFRYDVGNVWQVTEDIRFKDLRHGIGLSASFDTPIGEASFSVGKSFIIKRGLKKDSFIFGPYDFYFSIGYDI